jgi:ATP-dependent Lhr-like helicase
LIDGQPAAYIERGGRSMATFAATEAGQGWIEAMIDIVKDGRLRSLEIAKIDGQPAHESSFAEHLEARGFVAGYRGLTFRG